MARSVYRLSFRGPVAWMFDWERRMHADAPTAARVQISAVETVE